MSSSDRSQRCSRRDVDIYATLQEATSVSYARITACHLVGRLRRLAAASNVSRRKVRVFPLPGDAGGLRASP